MKLIRYLRCQDIVHIQHQQSLFPDEKQLIDLYAKCKRPIVTTLHDVVPIKDSNLKYYNSILNSSSRIIVHNELCKRQLLQWTDKDIDLIPHGTKLIHVPSKRKARKLLGLPNEIKIILSWGFIWESKGILDLVRILPKIKKSYPCAMLIHAGGPHPVTGASYQQTVWKTAVQLGLDDKDIIITDWVDEEKVPLFFGASDLIVLNYDRNCASASGAAHRVLSSSRPIVGTDDPCLLEIPKVQVPRCDEFSLLNAILKVLENKKVQRTFASKASAAARKTSWSNVALKHKKLYESLNEP